AHLIRTGQTVRLTAEGDPQPASGRLARISPSISEDNRTLLVEAEVPNSLGRLKPGSFVHAEIVVEEARQARPAVLVPTSAVVTYAGVDKVIGVESGHAREIEVRTGRHDETRIEILSGIAPGQEIVIKPGNLVSGEPVKVVR
ncbi:MAG: efflux RND transporter periplasmic adaptor subunit, partial [Acidobacteriota bacterium]|nr:efflux RND transporter periplasmic adaptor subunit [Acidobacteriota bacterium]